CGNPGILANLLISDLAGLLSKKGMDIVSCPIGPEKLCELADIIDRKELNSKQAKEVLKAMFTDGGSPKDIIIAKGYSRLNDEKAILAVIEEVLTEDLKAVDDYKKGRQKALSYLAGRIMTKTKGNADPEIVTRLLTNELAKR
ncbi:MAG: hypothetical protein IKE38_01210, partial [Erysipelotrichaceae bacterium]|nr:hypothetical protein [Erysipelotrichaceae bacterium]